MRSLMKMVVLMHLYLIDFVSFVWADDPEKTVQEFSEKSVLMLKGPIAKLLGVVILLSGVASLLRGRYKLAIASAVAFVMLLFLPLLLERVATG